MNQSLSFGFCPGDLAECTMLDCAFVQLTQKWELESSLASKVLFRWLFRVITFLLGWIDLELRWYAAEIALRRSLDKVSLIVTALGLLQWTLQKAAESTSTHNAHFPIVALKIGSMMNLIWFPDCQVCQRAG